MNAAAPSSALLVFTEDGELLRTGRRYWWLYQSPEGESRADVLDDYIVTLQAINEDGLVLLCDDGTEMGVPLPSRTPGCLSRTFDRLRSQHPQYGWVYEFDKAAGAKDVLPAKARPHKARRQEIVELARDIIVQQAGREMYVGEAAIQKAIQVAKQFYTGVDQC